MCSTRDMSVPWDTPAYASPAPGGHRRSAGAVHPEDGAVLALRKALALEPNNKAAADGLKWLLRPAASAVSKETPPK